MNPQIETRPESAAKDSSFARIAAQAWQGTRHASAKAYEAPVEPSHTPGTCVDCGCGLNNLKTRRCRDCYDKQPRNTVGLKRGLA